MRRARRRPSCAAMGLEVEARRGGQPARRGCAGGRGERTILLCAHLDTVPPVAPIEPVLVDDGWENANAGILGADNKSAVAMILEVARRCSVEGSPVGLELLFTVAEEVGLQGAKRFDASQAALGVRLRLRPRDADRRDRHRLADALPHRGRVPRQVRPRRAAPGGRAARRSSPPPTRRSRCRTAASTTQTTANLGYLHGGVESTNVVPERARVLAEVRSVDPDRAEEVLAAMIDALHDGASHGECDVDVITEKQVVGYRVKPSSPAVVAAEAALRAHGYEPSRIATGGASDANVLEAAGIPTRQRRQRHRAQPRADRARLGRRAGVDARRGVHPARRGGRGMSSELRAHRLRDRSSTASSSTSAATASATRTARRSTASSSATRAPSASSSSTTRTSCGSSASRARPIGIPDLLEIPAGKLDVEGEDPLEAAKRELAEEIGKQADALGVARLVLHLAGLRRRGDPPLPRHRHLRRRERPEVEEDERIDIEVRPLADLDAILAENQDSKTLIALYRLKDRPAAERRRRWRALERPRAALARCARRRGAPAAGRLHPKGSREHRRDERWPSSTLAPSRPHPPSRSSTSCSTSSPTSSSSAGCRATRSRRTARTCSSTARTCTGRDALAVTHSDLAGVRLLAGRR